MPKAHHTKYLFVSGSRFNRLTVISGPFQSKSRGGPHYLCRCDCGTEKAVAGSYLSKGQVKSCGCHKRDRMAAIAINRTTHGDTSGGVASSEYVIWAGMIARCHDRNSPNYKRYGDRGIKVCDRWRESYESFLSDVGRRPSASHSLDRFPDQDGNYGPSNVRWATSKEQGRNKRSNVIVSAFGKSFCLSEWAERSGLKLNTISNRIKSGWPAERAVSAPAGSPRYGTDRLEVDVA